MESCGVAGVGSEVCGGMFYAWRWVGMPYWPAVYFSNELYADAMSIRIGQAPH
jgi:hypothetical protein